MSFHDFANFDADAVAAVEASCQDSVNESRKLIRAIIELRVKRYVCFSK